MSRTVTFQGLTLIVPDAYSFTDVSRLLTPTSAGVGIVALIGESDGGAPGLHLFPGGASSAVVKKELKSGPGANMVARVLASGGDSLAPNGASTVFFYKTNNSTLAQALLNRPATVAVAQIVNLTCVADVAASLDGKYFILSSPTEKVGFWFDVDNNGTLIPPALAGLTDRQVSILTVTTGDSAAIVAGKVKIAIDADAAFIATVSGAIVTSVNATAGVPFGLVSAGTSTFTVAITTNGAAAVASALKATLKTRSYGLFTNLFFVSLFTSLGISYLSVTDDLGIVEKSPGFGNSSYLKLKYNGNGTASTASFAYVGSDLTLTTTVTGATDGSVGFTQIVDDKLTVQQLAAIITSKTGFGATYDSKDSQVKAGLLDLIVVPVSILTEKLFKGSYLEAIDWATNRSSTLQSLERLPNNDNDTLVGLNLTNVSFTGGTRGTSTNSDVQAAYNAILKQRINIAVPLFSSDNQDGSTVLADSAFAIHKDHLLSRSSIFGRSECVGYVGVDGNKARFLDVIANMNSRRVGVVSAKPKELDIDGNIVEMPSYAMACLLARTQAGSPIGTPLTGRTLNVNGFTVDPSWDPDFDGPEIIQKGGIVINRNENNAIEIINGYTSWTQDTNNANIYIETVESLDIFAFNHRLYMKEKFKGRSRFSSVDVLNAIAESQNAEVQNTGSIKGIDSKQTKLTQADTGQLRYELAVVPWEGIVFILPTIIAIREVA
jgi:hypothetical protein